MTYQFDAPSPTKLCDLVLADTVMRLIVEDYQKPSTVAESAFTSALTLIKNLDDAEMVMEFADRAEVLIERLRRTVVE